MFLGGCPCCGRPSCWRCYTDGTDYECVGPDDTPQTGWLPVGDCHETEDECKEECIAPPVGLCCIPPLTLNGPYQCENITKEECKSKGGNFYEGYESEFCDQLEVDPLCGQGIMCEDDEPKCVDQGIFECIEYTVTIDSIEKQLTECALSFTNGTTFGNGYPISENLSPPCGPEIPGFTPKFRWLENSVTIRDGEIGVLTAEIDLGNLISINAHQNALFPDSPNPPTADSPNYSGDVSCKIIQEFPFFVVGCIISGDNGSAEISIGRPFPPKCQLPSDTYQLDGNRNGDQFVVGTNEFVAGVSELKTFTPGVLRLPFCLCGDSCVSEEFDVKYTFGSKDFGFETVRWWPSNEPRPQDNFFLGTEWIIESDQEWTLSLTQTVVECEDIKKSEPGGRTMPQTKTGPGTELANLLKTIGIDAKEKGCSCRSHAKRMDKEGPQWCRDNIETILGWLQTEAKKRKLPFIKTAAKQVVLLAIRRAEKKS